MNLTDLLAQVRSALVEPVDGFWTDTELLRWVNRAQSDYVNRTRVLEDKDITTTVAGINEYPLPNNCLSVKAVFVNRATAGQSDDWTRIMPSNLEKYAQQSPNFMGAGNTGTPAAYMVWGRTLFLNPIPDTTGMSILMFYKAKPIEVITVDDQLDLDDSLHEAVIAYVLWRAFEKEREEEKAAANREIYEGYIRHGLRWQKRQSGDQRNRLDISSPTPLEGPYDTRFNPLA